MSVYLRENHERQLSSYHLEPAQYTSEKIEEEEGLSASFSKQDSVVSVQKFIQSGAQLPAQDYHHSTSTTLPPSIKNFFLHPGIPSDFDPYQAARDCPVHRQLMRVADYFEKRCTDYSIESSTVLAEILVSEIRDASPLIELGARYHLTCRLFKLASRSKIEIKEIAAIYNFMTFKNTFVPSWRCMLYAMRPSVLGRIASDIAENLTLGPSLQGNIVQATLIVKAYIKELKQMISEQASEKSDQIWIEGEWSKPSVSSIDGQWVESSLFSKSVSRMLECAETVFRHTLARKIVASIAPSYKAIYQKTGKPPEEISNTIAQITAFLKVSPDDALLRKMCHPLCDPAKDFISKTFGTENFQALSNEIEQDAQKQRQNTAFYSKFLPSFLLTSDAQINQTQKERLQAISWAQKQWDSQELIAYTNSPSSLPSQSIKGLAPEPKIFIPPTPQLPGAKSSRVVTPTALTLTPEHSPVSYLHLAFGHLQGKDVKAIWNAFPIQVKIDALRHIYSGRFQIEKASERFPLEYTLLQWLKEAEKYNFYTTVKKKMSALEKQSHITESTELHRKEGEDLLLFYYTPHEKNSDFYAQLRKRIEHFTAKAPKKLFTYLEQQAHAAGWRDFNADSSPKDCSHPKIFLHAIQAIERYLHTS